MEKDHINLQFNHLRLACGRRVYDSICETQKRCKITQISESKKSPFSRENEDSSIINYAFKIMNYFTVTFSGFFVLAANSSTALNQSASVGYFHLSQPPPK